MKTIFITGTDTAVGKTIVSRALLQCFAQANVSVVGYKPIARCAIHTDYGLRSKDGLILQNASSFALPYEAVNPLLFEEEEISTVPGKAIDYASLSAGLDSLRQQAERVVVEGTGGWRSVMNDGRPLSSWVAEHQLPVIMVVGIQTGCISHALLTAESIAADGLTLVGWVANRINPGLANYANIIAVLRDKISAPLVGELPYLSRPEQRDLTRYLDISSLPDINVHTAGA